METALLLIFLTNFPSQKLVWVATTVPADQCPFIVEEKAAQCPDRFIEAQCIGQDNRSFYMKRRVL